MLIADNPIQKQNTDILEKLVNRCLDILRTLSITRNSKSNIESSKICMDGLRNQIEVMKNHETDLLRNRSALTEQNEYFFYISLFVSTLISLLAITFAMRQVRRRQIDTEREMTLRAKDGLKKDLVAKIATLFSDDRSIRETTDELLQIFANQFNALAGRFFLFDRGKLVPQGTYGITDDRADFVLVREALQRKETWQIDGIPDHYWKISSALGESTPKALVFVPIHFQDEPLGVIELGAFRPLSPDQLDLLNGISESIGIGSNAILAKEQLQHLYEQTQQMAEELQTQSEELRSNNEELESQQETLQKKNEDLQMAQEELVQKASELQLSNQYKSEFLAKMSHELRTPLNGLLLLSTLLVENKEKNLTEQQRQFANSIYNAGNDLLTLINDILDLSKIEARKLSLRPEEFSLELFFNHLSRTFEHQITDKKLKFSVEISENAKKTQLYTDRQRLEQILRNFISNAIKFTPEGSITLGAALVQGGTHLKLSVADTGIGIPIEKQNLIFEAFEQVDSSISRKYGGTGLGLTISRELATLLGGEIRVKSVEGNGSEFGVVIPIQIPAGLLHEAPIPKMKSFSTETPSVPQAQPLNSEIQKQLEKIPEKARTILIVEDDEKFVKSIAEAVVSYQFHPIEAENSETALAILDRHVPDAILLDIKLPGISGLSLLETIKSMSHLRHIPIHMISALDYQHNALRMGALGYLTKPVSLEKVRAALSRIENLISNQLRKVLLIEDDERQRNAISELVSGQDVEVHSVRTGKEAIEELKKQPYDCIILDLSLPDISGSDLLPQLNALDISLPPIVIYTGKALSYEEEEYLRRFSESIIIKGARSPERLLDEVNLFLHRIEALLPHNKREMLTLLRSQEQFFEGKTVLIVDDDIRNIFALTSVLESKNLQVRVAKNGLEAIESLKQHPDTDLVLMDIMMPKMDGYETMSILRKSEEEYLRKIPIVALTAKAMKDDYEKCIAAGANDYLPKPVNVDNLMTVLKVWLSPKGV